MNSVSGVKVGLGLRIRIGHVPSIDLLNKHFGLYYALGITFSV